MGLILFALAMMFFTSQEIESYWYLESKINRGDENDEHTIILKMSHSNIAWNCLGLHHLAIPIMVVIFKRSEDIVMAVSKLSDLAMVSSIL